MATTKYRVLRKRPAPAAPAVSGGPLSAPVPGAATTSSAGDAAAAPETFEVLFRNVEASSAQQALQLALADVADASGTYTAVPERNWTEITVASEPRPNKLVFS